MRGVKTTRPEIANSSFINDMQSGRVNKFTLANFGQQIEDSRT